MDSEIKAVLLALSSIVVGIAALLNENYRLYLIVLYTIFVVIYLLSSYINKVEKHEKDIMEMNKKLEIHERLAKLEGKVFR